MKHGLEILENSLDGIGKTLEKNVKVYLIGGCALTFKKLKESTKDVDMILASINDLDELNKALERLGYSLKFKSEFAYRKARNVFEKENCPSFDLFYRDICGGLGFSSEMKKRAQPLKKHGKLELFLVSDEDIFLFKSVAGREGDLEDALELYKKGISWKTIEKEIENQRLLFKKDWLVHFAVFVSDLHDKYDLPVPAELKKAMKQAERLIRKKMQKRRPLE